MIIHYVSGFVKQIAPLIRDLSIFIFEGTASTDLGSWDDVALFVSFEVSNNVALVELPRLSSRWHLHNNLVLLVLEVVESVVLNEHV